MQALAPGLDDDPRGRLRLAETVRSLYGELAPQGKGFDELARGAGPGETARFAALAAAQREYRRLLDGLGHVDPHEGRSSAIEFGRVDRTRRVVLVGVADMNRLLARLCSELCERLHVLVVAPPELADGFDEWGRLVTEFWRQRDVPIPLAAWHVVEKPVDQALEAARVIAGFGGRFAPDEITLGLADEQVAPYLEHLLAGVEVRSAAGTPLVRTRPWRLLRAVARYLARGGFPELAELARDPDLGAVMLEHADVAAALDLYHEVHLPMRGDGDWAADGERLPAVEAAVGRLRRRLGVLAERRPRPLAEWAEPVRAFLAGVYGAAGLDPAREEERVLAGALEQVGTALSELEETPPELAGAELTGAEALELLLRHLRGAHVAPPVGPGADGRPALELVGWLDLALDDAPAACVTGFNAIPASTRAHAFLPDGLRKQLGLPCDADRLARDVYLATILCTSRAELAFISGRRSLEGDPLTPSRLAFHVPEAEVPERVRRYLRPPVRPEPATIPAAATGVARAPAAGPIALSKLSVSGFGAYLKSPLGFYFTYVLGLKSLDDRARELDPLRFGKFAHDVLQLFGEGAARDASDAPTIQAFLDAALDELARTRFGPRPLAAVLLQKEQLRYRLHRFAEHQARRVRAGWRIVAVERELTRELDVDLEPLLVKGKLDRIDVHPASGAWAVLDYKTGDYQAPPRKAHRNTAGEWLDLQLPLYRWLCEGLGAELGARAEPELGYAKICPKDEDVGFATHVWPPEELADALAQARNIVRAVRAGRFEGQGRRAPDPRFEPILAALHGVGLIGAGDEEQDDA
jgi:hypothetical protein